MNKWIVIFIFLTIGVVCGWANEVKMKENAICAETDETVICGEIQSYIAECQPCVIIRGCDGEEYRLLVSKAPHCKFIKITNPVWGEVHSQCPVEGGGDAEVSYREVHAWCITNYTSIECISSCEECDNPCFDVSCSPECFGCDLWALKCVDGVCIQDHIIAKNSEECECEDLACGTACIGMDLWSLKHVGEECEPDQLIESDSAVCGFNLCDGHCTNQQKDCGEYGIDCGGGCPFTDSDYDGVEDCKDVCPDSRCSTVDSNGCETDVDHDGVRDCDDECPHEKGDSSNRGCPASVLPIVAGIGAAAAVTGGAAFKIIKGGKIAEEASKRAGEKVN